MKLSTEFKMDKNQKIYDKAFKQLKKKYNISSVQSTDLRFTLYKINNKGLTIYMAKDGIVSGRILRLLSENLRDLQRVYRGVLKYREIEINNLSEAKAFVWVSKNLTKEWSSSPYSLSFYSSKSISWSHKPINSIRVSNHWNFNTYDELERGIEDGRHCPTFNKDFLRGWAACIWTGNKYKLLKKF